MRAKNSFNFLVVVVLVLGLMISSIAWGGSPSASIGDVAGSIFGVGRSVQKILKTVCIIAGVSLILTSLLQYKKHRQNPIETTWGTVIFTFVTGVAIIGLSFIPMEV